MILFSRVLILLVVVASVTSCITTEEETFPDKPVSVTKTNKGPQGRVILRIQVGEDGAPTSVEVVQSTGHRELDQAAKEWVQKKWRLPRGDVRTFNVPVDFRLR
jgi:protein TonB